MYLESLDSLAPDTVLRNEDIDVSNCYHILAELSHKIGKYTEAENYSTRALTIRRNYVGSSYYIMDISRGIDLLAQVNFSKGNYSKALELQAKSLKLAQQTFGRDHPHVAQSLHDLANLHYRLGRLESAELMYREALYIREKLLGNFHYDVALR